jgi:hypothetical protein
MEVVNMMIKLHGIFLVLVGITILSFIYASPTDAFLYSNSGFSNSEFNSQNMLQNGWFKGSDCKPSGAGWQNPGSWGFTDKEQDPTDSSCPSSTGFAARKADTENAVSNALLWQVVGPVNNTNKTLHFHSLIVAHRVYQYKAEIYGSNSSGGPWTSVWVPFNIQNCLTNDCVNETYGKACNTGDRQCLWDDVSVDILGSLSPVTKTISQGYSNYKIEFTMSYPPDNGVGAGDNGGKLARVFFKVSGGSSATPTPTKPIPTPTLSTLPKAGDANGDGVRDGKDYVVWLKHYGQTTSNKNTDGDFSQNGTVGVEDYSIWVSNYRK